MLLPLALAAVTAGPVLRAQTGGATAHPPADQNQAAGLSQPAQRKAAQLKLPVSKIAPNVPLNARERAVQMLNRFTYGPRPGDVDAVAAQGADKWFEQQLHPATIPDNALNTRLAQYPTLTMPTEQILAIYPDQGNIRAVMEGKVPYPADPLLASVYEVQVYKAQIQSSEKEQTKPLPTQEEQDAQKKADRATAARIAGELFALPKDERMKALNAMPVKDRIAFANNVGGPQRDTLFNDLTPREREAIYAMQGGVGASYREVDELSQAKVLRSILSERQLQEVMTDFWFNHFNVFVPKDSDQWYTTSYERDVIRPNALGKFRDLLLATAESPAMMVYLDNYLSIGPDSIANGMNPANPNSKKGNRGLNENYGREVMELHTVGVNGGYTQADVTHLSAILTGWGVERPNQAGPFQYDPKKHEPGTKTWFGYTIDDHGNVLAGPANAVKIPAIPANVPDGMRQGVAALDILAGSPKTAHFISYLIAQRFLADDPPEAVVQKMAAAFLASDGDISTVLRTLVATPEFNSHRYFRNKVKTPLEYVASVFRATQTDPVNPGALVGALDKPFGERLYWALPPTGYYITANVWMNTQSLMGRLNFADQLTRNAFANQKFDSPRLLGICLMTDRNPIAVMPGAERLASVDAKPGVAREVQVAAATSAPAAPGAVRGPDFALHLLEGALIAGEIWPNTDRFIHSQIALQPAGNPTGTLNLLTALLLGSPEFQLR
jgi:uncharacterized protein (DUF1800 family)